MSLRLAESEVLIVGAAGFAAEVYRWATSSTAFVPAGFVVKDGSDPVSPVEGVPCYHESALHGISGKAYVAIGDPALRQRVVERLKADTALTFPNLIHRTAIVDSSVTLGEGNLILPYSVVCPLASMGAFNVLNLYASLGHEAAIGDFNTLSPYATLNGQAACEHLCFLGSHATLGPGVRMGRAARLSANSFGSKEIPEGGLAFGVPAKTARMKADDE